MFCSAYLQYNTSKPSSTMISLFLISLESPFKVGVGMETINQGSSVPDSADLKTAELVVGLLPCLHNNYTH